jgi:hypothetical protein
MKRKFIEYQCASSVNFSTRSKKPCLVRPINIFNNYVSASSVINYLQNDCLLDWLKIRKELNVSDKRWKEENFLCEQGNKFEKAVVEYLNQNVCQTVKVSDPLDWNEKGVKKTLDLMKSATPIIYSAPVRSKNLKLFGTVDLLVRNDYLSKIFTDLVHPEEDIVNSILPHNYYYLVVDIKWCTLPLRSNGEELLNTDRIPGYKGQLTVYNYCISEMQGFKPTKTYLLGRKYRYQKQGIIKINNSPFERPGVFNTNDKSFSFKVDKAIQWIRDLEKTGSVMTLNPPVIPELYPNLGSKYYFSKKKELALDVGDLSLLYGIKNKLKELSFSKKIFNFRDERFCGDILGLKDKKLNILNNILKVNRLGKFKNDKLYTSDLLKNVQNKYLPLKMKNNLYNWKSIRNEIFVDFEKITDIIDDFSDISNHKNMDTIFLIGVGWMENGIWNYTKFLAENLNKEGEYKIINNFLTFVREKNNPRIWYYFAENKFWDRAIKKHGINISSRESNLERRNTDISLVDFRTKNTNQKLEWLDLRNVLLEEPFSLKGCYDYKLKSILEAMKDNDLIDLKNNSEVKDGFTAMLNAYKYYQGENQDMMDEIIEYNKYDVKGMYQILKFIRKIK